MPAKRCKPLASRNSELHENKGRPKAAFAGEVPAYLL
jgi:hypothetical protein